METILTIAVVAIAIPVGAYYIGKFGVIGLLDGIKYHKSFYEEDD